MNYILVPYRNREYDLKRFFEKMPVILTELFESNWHVCIIEQVYGKQFNRGKLINAGILLVNDMSGNYFIHDVDTIPNTVESKARYLIDCSDKIVGIYNSNCDTLGGICKLSGHTFHKMNGFPNGYWGWGAEDKAFQNRAEFIGCKIDKLFVSDASGNAHFSFGNKSINDTKDKQILPTVTKMDYELYRHVDDSGNIHISFSDTFIESIKNDTPSYLRTNLEYNMFKNMNSTKKHEFIYKNGVNNCNYKLNNKIELTSQLTIYMVDI